DGDTQTSWNVPSTNGDFTVDNAWIKFHLASTPKTILFVWHSGSAPDYTVDPETNFGTPTDYTIDVSPTGADGTWKNAVTVSSDASKGRTYRSRAHRIAFEGMSYVRMTIQKVVSTQPGPPHPSIGEIEVYDVSTSA